MIRDFLDALTDDVAYDFIANNYYKMSKEDLKDILLEAIAVIDDNDLKYDLSQGIREWRLDDEDDDDLYESKSLVRESRYALEPEYDSRASFYGKAIVEVNGNKQTLYSYNTKVAEIDGDTATVFGTYSQTTLRHIKEFLKQNGFTATTSKQIMNDYGA